jgi:hypothetical protein
MEVGLSSNHLLFIALSFVTIGELSAATITETGDAGQTLATAQLIPGPGSVPLTRISGSLTPTEADIFRIHISNGFFLAATVSDSSSFFDTQLFLFDSLGFGVFANDDDLFAPPQSTSAPGGPLSAGFYYLAVAGFGYDPVSGGGLIFPPVDNLLVLSSELRTATGPGGALPLSAFSGTSNQGGSYRIELAGVQTVPEPSSGAVLCLVFGCFALYRNRVRRR